ncbi:hypothetical protein BJV74DRAFT_157986 [Russula compacta]|nr:hypothetical protein BJV74DRAFT_157986 [Russula compacta]
MVVSSPLPSAAAPSSLQQAGTLMGSAPPPASALPSGSLSVPTSAATSTTSPATEGTISSLSPLGPVPPTSSSSVVTTTVPTSTALPSSTSNTATASSTLAAAAINASAPAHGASFWAGIALLGIAAAATIITLFLWWLRVRKRTHKRPWESRWPWGRAESYKFPEDAISSSGTSTSWWQPHGGDHDHVGEPRRSTSNLPSAVGASSSGSGSGLSIDLPHLLPANLSSMSPFAHGPYPTVRPLPLELRRSDTSVPGLVQDVGGSLRVANLVAGDILTSGDESSRPPTALDDNHDRDVVGTPRESGAMFRPRYLSLNGSGLDVPWIRTTPSAEMGSEPEREQEPGRGPRVGEGAAVPLDHHKWKERLERSSAAKPAAGSSHDSQPPLPAAQGTIEAWRDSLRNNIASAFGVFANTSAAPAPVPSRPSVTAYDWQQQQQHDSPVTRALSTASTISKPWTLEETRDGAGIVHIRGVPNPLVARHHHHHHPSSSSSAFSSSSPSRSNSRALPLLPPTPSSALRSLPHHTITTTPTPARIPRSAALAPSPAHASHTAHERRHGAQHVDEAAVRLAPAPWSRRWRRRRLPLAGALLVVVGGVGSDVGRL